MGLGKPSPCGVESGKKDSSKYIAAKKKIKGNLALLLNEPGYLMTKDIEKALKLRSACFALDFTGKICLQLRYPVPCGNNANVHADYCIIENYQSKKSSKTQ